MSSYLIKFFSVKEGDISKMLVPEIRTSFAFPAKSSFSLQLGGHISLKAWMVGTSAHTIQIMWT